MASSCSRLLATAATAALAASAEAAAIRGRFVEPPGDAPLAAVEVVARRAADSTVVAHTLSGTDGRFTLDGLPLGTYLLRASLLGHATLHRAGLELTEQAPVLELGTLPLAVAALALPGITATTERATSTVAPDRNIYLTKDMPAAASGMAVDILRTVSELEVDIEGRVSLRGSSSVNVQINGRPTPMTGDALATYLRQFPASRIERIEVIANPSARFDPEGTAGIVNLVLKDDVDLGLSGSLTLTAGLRYNGPSARVAWQKGPLSVFGGLSGNLGTGEFEYRSARQNLLAQPMSYFDVASGSDSRSGNANADLSVDYVLGKRFTFYSTFNQFINSFESDGLSHFALFDSARAVTSLYDRVSQGDYDGNTSSITLGLQHVVQKGRDERVLEFLSSVARNDNLTRGNSVRFLPTGPDDPRSEHAIASAQVNRSWEMSDTRPVPALGASGKLELGYRGSDRRNTRSAQLEYFEGDSLVLTPLSSATDDVHHERFHSGYVTLGSTFGKLSLQLGARAEAANTSFEVRATARTYDNDYRSLFPSANIAWDFGAGRTARVTYSKRIERPSSNFLNPFVPSPDSLNRSIGNPDLAPKYTHSYALEASWSGSRGMLRLSPFLRETIDNWDQVTLVDSSGVATTTWRNASSIRLIGSSFTGSLRQTKRLGGTVSVSVFRERHDAANIASGSQREATNWSANGNAIFKATNSLDLQLFLGYNPARTLAQGRVAAFSHTNLSARFKHNDRLSSSLWVSDPFRLYRYELETRDAAHVQNSFSRYASRGFALTVTWAWGKPPEQKQRRQTSESPQTPEGP